MNEISICLNYKVQGGNIFHNLQHELEKEFVVNIKSRPGTAAMGVWDSFVEIIINIELKDFSKLAAAGLAWDLVKSGTRKFFLKPMIQIFKEFESNNVTFDYSGLLLKFQDTDVVVYGLKNLFTSRLGTLMPALVKHYQNLIRDDEYPHTILVPLVYESERDAFVNYGGSEDFELEQYTQFWGISYDAFGEEQAVYNVQKSKLLPSSFDSY